MRKINRIQIYSNKNTKCSSVKRDLIIELKKYNFEIVEENPDLYISIGGDGSFLRCVRKNNFSCKNYYVGINSGTLGFLQEIDILDTKNFVKRLNNNDFKIERINYQINKIILNNDKILKFNSLNEIVIRDSDYKTLKCNVYIDGELIQHFAGDGLLVSTSTGSTAYNMSYGGSIIYNILSAKIITPIAPINNRVYHSLQNSVIIPSKKNINIVLENKEILVSVDGVNHIIKDVKKINIETCRYTIKCLRMNNFHFVKTINKKIIGD